MIKDYRVKITIRNEKILSKMESLGYVSVLNFCKKVGLPYQQVTEIINGKYKPLSMKGILKPFVQSVLDLLQMTPDEAFTDRQLQGFNKSGYVFKLKEQEMRQLVDPVQNQERKVIENDIKLKIVQAMHKRLNHREERFLSLRYGFNGGAEHTLEEISRMFNVTRERVRQIIKRAERKLKHPEVMDSIINTGFADLYTKVDISREQIERADDDDAFFDKLAKKHLH